MIFAAAKWQHTVLSKKPAPSQDQQLAPILATEVRVLIGQSSFFGYWRTVILPPQKSICHKAD